MVQSLIGSLSKRRVTITQQDNPSEILTFDASISESHTGNAETTSHPVEQGADITDHIRRSPEELTITGIVSDTPVVSLASLFAEPSVTGGDTRTRVSDAYGFLKDVKDNGRICQISTTLRDYENMVLVGFSVPRDAARGGIGELSCVFREIIIATTESAEVREPVAEGRKAQTDIGTKSKPAAESSSATQSRSLLASFVSGFGAF